MPRVASDVRSGTRTGARHDNRGAIGRCGTARYGTYTGIVSDVWHGSGRSVVHWRCPFNAAPTTVRDALLLLQYSSIPQQGSTTETRMRCHPQVGIDRVIQLLNRTPTPSHNVILHRLPRDASLTIVACPCAAARVQLASSALRIRGATPTPHLRPPHGSPQLTAYRAGGSYALMKPQAAWIQCADAEPKLAVTGIRCASNKKLRNKY